MYHDGDSAGHSDECRLCGVDGAAENLAGFVVLLAVIPLVLGYLLVRSEDPLEREGILGVRAMAVLSGIIPILGGLLLVFTHTLDSRHSSLNLARPVWAGLTITSWFIVLGISWSWCMAAPPREIDRTFRVANIAAISGAISAACLLVANILVSLTYLNLTQRELPRYLAGHRALVICAGALVIAGACALQGLVDGIRRTARRSGEGNGNSDAARRRRRPRVPHRLGAILVVGAGEVWIWATAVATLLVIWQAMTIEPTAKHAALIHPASVIIDATLVPAGLLVLLTAVWLSLRPEGLLGDPQLLFVGLLLGGIPIGLRVMSVLMPSFGPISSRAAWIGFALWIASTALAVRVPSAGQRPAIPEA